MSRRRTACELLLFCVALNLSIGVSNAECPAPSPCECQPSLNNQYRVIYCKGRRLTTVPTFSPSNEVFYELTLADNGITSIPDNAFVGLNVQIIDLRGNRITTFSNNCFVGLNKTLELFLESDNLAFPRQALLPLSGLTKLTLTKFNIPTLPDNAFSHMTSLESLTIEHSQMATINTSALVGVENSLQKLDLSNNLFTSLPYITNAISTLANIQSLSLQFLPVSEIQANTFSKLPRLERLLLSHCSISTIQPGAFRNMTNLKYLGLDHNQLKGDVPTEISMLTNLEELYLTYNQIANVPDGLFTGMSKLAYLTFHSNKISSVRTQMWTGVENSLRTLILSKNKIVMVSDGPFQNLHYLEDLQLGEQDMSSVLSNTTFKGLEKSLKRLKLNEVNFNYSQWPALQTLTGLRTLSLHDNQLTMIPDMAFKSMSLLETLDLAHNSIQTLTQRGMFGLQNSLEKITLRANPITSIGECVFYEFVALKEIEMISVNTLVCDCHMKWLRESKTIQLGLLSPKCASPPQHKDKEFRKIEASLLVCHNSTVNQSCTTLKSTVTPSTKKPTTPQQMTTTNIPATTTVELETTKPPFVRGLRIIGVELKAKQITIQWKVANTANLLGFKVNHRPESNSKEIWSRTLDTGQREYTIQNLSPKTKYSLCVNVVLVGQKLEELSRVCQISETKDVDRTDNNNGGSNNNNGGSNDRLTGIIVGSVIGAVVLVGLIIAGVIGIIYFSRKRKGNELGHFTGHEGGGVPMKDLPHIGVQSKGFTRRSVDDQGAVGGYDNGAFYETTPDGKTSDTQKNNKQLPPNNRDSNPRYVKKPDSIKGRGYIDNDGYVNPAGPRPAAPDEHKYYEIQSVHI